MAPDRGETRHLANFAQLVVAPLITIAFFAFFGAAAGASVRALRGDGVPGVFVLEHYGCGKSCDWNGTFISNDGTDVRHGTGIASGVPSGAKVHDRIPAIDTGGINVYPPQGSWSELILDLLFATVGFAGLAWWGWWYRNGIIRRRFPPPPRPEAATIGPPISVQEDDEYDTELRLQLLLLQRRRYAREIVETDPDFADELAIGRPDLSRGFVDGGLIDVNTVPAWVLADLPGFTSELAEQVVAARDLPLGLRSGVDLVIRTDVPADVVIGLSDVLLFRKPSEHHRRPS